MAKFNIAVPHEMERNHAVAKLKNFSDQAKSMAEGQVTDLVEDWDESGNLSFSFKALGFKVSGQMVTCEQQVTVVGDFPFAALPFRGAIESQLKDKIKQAIA